MGHASSSNSPLPEYRVEVVEPGHLARRHWVCCEIERDLEFDVMGLQSYCLARWDERIFDLLVVVAAVEFCDRAKARPSQAWGRDFALRVPVHDPSHWTAVSAALCNALFFLTGDRWRLEFVGRSAKVQPPLQGTFDMLVDNARVVIPYSDGLDSYAVAGLAKRQYGRNVLRVRLGSRPLAEGQVGDRPLPFAYIPYHVRCPNGAGAETSARSRGFKFAALSGVAAFLSGADKVIMPESGQGSLGPSLVPVGHVYEDYRSHPQFTDRMTAFLTALLDYGVRYSHPRLWHTKAETLCEFVAKSPERSNWAQTRSCWQNQRHASVSGSFRQCGVCAACMLRRMSVHAAGLVESRDSYIWEDLTAGRYEDGANTSYSKRKPVGSMHEYAIAGTLHLEHLARCLQFSGDQPGLSRQAFQLSRSLQLTEDETQTKLERLIAQHHKEWGDFVDFLGPKSFVAQWIGRGVSYV